MRSAGWLCLAAGLALAACNGDKDTAPGDTAGGGTPTTPTTISSQPELTGLEREAVVVAHLDEGVAANGKLLYDEPGGCGPCHAPDGTGYNDYPSLVDTLPTLTDAQLVHIMMTGFNVTVGADMPGYASSWTNQQLVDVVAYCEETFNPGS